MLLTATVLFVDHLNPGNATYAQAMRPFVGPVVSALFAVGLTEAGFVAATTMSLSSSWAFTEVMGLARSLNQSVRQAPVFYVTYFGEVLIAGAVVLIPHAPLTLIALLVQVVNTVLMPPALMFLLLFLNDRSLMGAHVNTRFQNILVGGTAVLLFLLSAIYGLTLLFPHLLGWPLSAGVSRGDTHGAANQRGERPSIATVCVQSQHPSGAMELAWIPSFYANSNCVSFGAGITEVYGYPASGAR